eukprot:gnl/MRDRNA2_/MRDRNA2_177637_c0_seq1.p1 gnl/MRDRNA2_/MRDRNA2_177637_c0~~gnl/MRDRNA2_/MRDRNA2_177637_c0_seq1.p1  ORF type:complete len:452 (+),score=58.43 gnl/MRDRNA2_/MRDRNA2_177637_c0_seq1:183-1358(+)
MFFAGTITHGREFQRGSGNVIKGFRHNSRSLLRIFRERFHEQKWANAYFQYRMPKDYTAFLAHVSRRLNTGSALAAQHSTMADGFTYDRKTGLIEYREEVPVDFFYSKFAHLDRIVLAWSWLAQRMRLEFSFGHGSGFGPSLFWWAADPTHAIHNCTQKFTSQEVCYKIFRQQKASMQLYEELHTEWRNVGVWTAIDGFIRKFFPQPAGTAMVSAGKVTSKKQTSKYQREKRKIPEWNEAKFVTIDVVPTNEVNQEIAIFVQSSSTVTFLQPGEYQKLRGRHGSILWAIVCTLPLHLREQLQSQDQLNGATRVFDVPVDLEGENEKIFVKQLIKMRALRWEVEFAWGLRQEVYIAENDFHQPAGERMEHFASACTRLISFLGSTQGRAETH